MQMKRREFLKNSAHTAIAAIVVRYVEPAQAHALSRPGMVNSEEQWWSAKQLYEGAVKVTGGKIYAIDFRAQELPGWPVTERRAVILRANTHHRPLMAIDVQGLRRQFGNISIVTGDTLHRWGCKGAAPFLLPDFYVRSGQSPEYFGQALALLSFENADHYLLHKSKLSGLTDLVRFGPSYSPKTRENYGTSQFVYYQGHAEDPEFSFMKDAQDHDDPASPLHEGEKSRRVEHFVQKIEEEIRSSGWLSLKQSFTTQSVDPLFMEPENGLAWYDSASGTLSLMLGTQSPHEDALAITKFFANAQTPPIRKIVVNCCYLGGGFGGKDSSDFPLHLAIAAISEPDVSHRLVHNRFDQFQAGLKRHAAAVDLEIAVDRKGQFQALRSQVTLDGGGQNNYSFAIQSVAARNAAGAYRFGRSIVNAVALPSASIPAGSMRGFGTFQSCFALECLIDEAAQALHMDPIALRLKNCIQDDGYIHTGVKLATPVHAHQVLRAAQASRIWQTRHRTRAEKTKGDILYGTGFAAAFKTFGKNENGCLAGVELTENGHLKLYTPAVDMGNGAATTLALSLKSLLGRPADEVHIGVTGHFDALQLVSSEAKTETEQDMLAANPFWTPSIAISSAASTSAYHLRHVVLQAARVVLDHGLLPAAALYLNLNVQDLLSEPDAFTLRPDGLRYRDGRVITYEELAKLIYSRGLISGAMVHGYYRESWAQAEFVLTGRRHRADIDGLAIRHGQGPYSAIARETVRYSSLQSLQGDANRMSSYAVIVSVAVNRSTGEVKVVDAEGFVECGPVILKETVMGQMQGAFAMGIGQALMENLSQEDRNAGQGQWNLHLYRAPRAADCALNAAEFHIVSNDSGEPKGMSEVVFNPVPSAIANAIANATRKRFRALPIQPKDVMEALRT